MMASQVRRILASWGRKKAFGGWNPSIPPAVLAFLKNSFSPDSEDAQALSEARDSIDALLPRLLDTLHKTQGEHYYGSASESKGHIFYFFAPRHPVDAFNLTLQIKGDKAHLSFGYMPYKVNGQLDIQQMKSEKTIIEPELAGMALMRLVRNLTGRI